MLATSPIQQFIGKVVLQLTGTKRQDRIVWVRLRQLIPDTPQQFGGWQVCRHDQEIYTLTAQPNCLFSLDGIDLFDGKPAADHYRDLISEYLVKHGRTPLPAQRTSHR